MNDDNKPQGNSDWLKTFDLDLEDKVTCDGIGCNEEAFKYCKVSCCGTVMVACPEHLAKAYNLMLNLAVNDSPVYCRKCGAANNPQGWLGKPLPLALEV